jgi:hypothetical protein
MGATFSAVGDFGSTNPSGVWSYGQAAPSDLNNLDAAFSLLPGFTPNCSSGGGFHADCWSGTSFMSSPTGTFNTGTVNYVAGFVNLHPGSDGTLAILAFTAPIAGTYDFLGQWADHDVVGGSGVDLYERLGDGTDLLTSAQHVQDWSATPVSINFSQALSAGQSVYFALGYNGEWSFDSTGLQLDVTGPDTTSTPEPASITLVALSGGALLLKRRRAR